MKGIPQGRDAKEFREEAVRMVAELSDYRRIWQKTALKRYHYFGQ